MTASARAERPPPVPSAVVFVSPHPDDEVLGAGALLRRWAQAGCAIDVVACTDGEASHARSTAITPDELRSRRAAERDAAFRILGLEARVERLGLPDGALGEWVDDLTGAIESALASRSGAVVVAPWAGDDHPDHGAAHAAAAAACRRAGALLWEVPIWGKVRTGSGASAGRRHSVIALSSSERAIKAAAVAEFVTQIVPVGEGRFDGPVVHPAELDAMLDGTEIVYW